MEYVELVSHVVKSVQAIGAKAHLETVENEQELIFAVACGFDRFQGFGLCRPDSLLSTGAIELPV